jgi:2-C-methyl-D-erythritol 4-phosphate cytidylyltransferase/2-C-methyl-D-erythritol 2,4-cyclodiphosphate synthase
MGDIGEHFSPSDDRWKNANSAIFLRHAIDLLQQRDGRIVNMDITLICESPKISPHKMLMRERIAEVVGVDVSRVSIKATTTEQLGFTGRKEGVAAQAVVTIEWPMEEARATYS